MLERVVSELRTQKLTRAPENAYSCSSLAMRLLVSMPSRRQAVEGTLAIVLGVKLVLSWRGEDGNSCAIRQRHHRSGLLI